MTVHHRSTTFSGVTRALQFAVVAACAAAGVACTTVETKVRVVSRAGALRDVVVVPAVADAPIRIVAGPDVVTDEELALLEQQLPERLRTAIVLAGAPIGEIRAVRVRVSAAPGRERHRTSVDCRLRLTVGDDVVADVEGSTVQFVQARNISVVELDGIRAEMAKNGGRNPLLTLTDTEAAIIEACSAALNAIVDERLPADVNVDRENGVGSAKETRRFQRSERRRRAVERLEAELVRSPRRNDVVAAALVDIGDAGVVADAAPVARFLHDKNALVRRAATSAFQTLCAGHAALGVDKKLCAPPPPPPLPPPPPPTSVEPATPIDTEPTPEELQRRPDGDFAGAEGEREPLPTIVPTTTTAPTTTTTPPLIMTEPAIIEGPR